MDKFLKFTSARAVILILVAVIGILYSPVLTAFFNADDFNFLNFLHFDIERLLNGQHWNEWFIGGIVNYTVFRPIGNLFWMLNYVTFGLDSPGYHIVTVLFHLIASFAVFLLVYLLTRKRMIAGIAALLFAIMPVHAEAVSWVAANYDVLSGMYTFIALIFYILYRQSNSLKFYFVAIGAFAFALSSKETAVTFPILVFIYDAVYHSQDWTRLIFAPRDWTRALRVWIGYAPFGIVFALRFLFFGLGYRGLTFAPEGWLYYVDFNLLRVFDPLSESLGDLRWIAVVCAALLLLAFRFRGVVFFSLIWIPVTLIPTTVGGISDRSFYIPSLGVSLLLALVLGALLEHKATLTRAIGLVILGAVIVIYGASLFARNQAYARASQVTQAILQRVKELQPTVPSEARLVFVGVPDYVPEGPPVFSVGLPDAIHVLYDNQTLRVIKATQFPLWLDDLEHSYFFEVDHRRVTERADLIAMLETRKRCSVFSRAAQTWDLANDLQGWEPWNELDRFEHREGAWMARSTGNDPFMGGPAFDIPALAIGDIEITLRVRASQPTFEGAVYWLVSGQSDFAPSLKQSFIGKSDGEFHTYRVNIAQTGLLPLNGHITQLRFDPVNMPAEIAIKSIHVNTHCHSTATEPCACDR